MDRVHKIYPDPTARYSVKFADVHVQYVHANLRLASNVIGRAVNDAGAEVKPGGGSGVCRHKFYCGRKLDQVTIPGSDGQCGPNTGW